MPRPVDWGTCRRDCRARLRRRDVDVRVLLPAYPEVIAKANDITVVAHLPGHAGIDPCCIGEARTADGLILYLVLEPSLYQRTGSPYAGPEGHDWPDNDLRFARLSLAAAEIAAGRAGMTWQPDLLHVNDWPGGLAPAYLRWQGARVPTILTIHNIAYQGLCDRERMPLLGIPERAFHINGVEFHDRVSFLKAGLFYADHVSTVSPTYAREITTEAFGAGLHGLTSGIAAEGRLSGIVNGIDETWDPSRDPHLPHHFEADDLSGKQANADLVRTGLCLKHSEGPLFGVVSRLVHQKGLDIVADTARDIVREGGQIAILGPGRSRHRAHAEPAGAQPSRPYRPADRLQRADGAADRRRQRLLPDAVALRAVRADADAGAALRLAADRAPRPAAWPTRSMTARPGSCSPTCRARACSAPAAGRSRRSTIPTCWPRCARPRWRAASTGRARRRNTSSSMRG